MSGPLTFEAKDFISVAIQLIAIISTGLALYYRLKGQIDANTKDITAILHEMGNNGFVRRAALQDQWKIAEEIHKRQDETMAQINEEIDRMRDTIDSMQATLRRRAVE